MNFWYEAVCNILLYVDPAFSFALLTLLVTLFIPVAVFLSNGATKSKNFPADLKLILNKVLNIRFTFIGLLIFFAGSVYWSNLKNNFQTSQTYEPFWLYSLALSFLFISTGLFLLIKSLVGSFRWLASRESETHTGYRNRIRVKYLDKLKAADGEIWTDILTKKKYRNFAPDDVIIDKWLSFRKKTKMFFSLDNYFYQFIDNSSEIEGRSLQLISNRIDNTNKDWYFFRRFLK